MVFFCRAHMMVGRFTYQSNVWYCKITFIRFKYTHKIQIRFKVRNTHILLMDNTYFLRFKHISSTLHYILEAVPLLIVNTTKTNWYFHTLFYNGWASCLKKYVQQHNRFVHDLSNSMPSETKPWKSPFLSASLMPLHMRFCYHHIFKK